MYTCIYNSKQSNECRRCKNQNTRPKFDNMILHCPPVPIKFPEKLKKYWEVVYDDPCPIRQAWNLHFEQTDNRF